MFHLCRVLRSPSVRSLRTVMRRSQRCWDRNVEVAFTPPQPAPSGRNSITGKWAKTGTKDGFFIIAYNGSPVWLKKFYAWGDRKWSGNASEPHKPLVHTLREKEPSVMELHTSASKRSCFIISHHIISLSLSVSPFLSPVVHAPPPTICFFYTFLLFLTCSPIILVSFLAEYLKLFPLRTFRNLHGGIFHNFWAEFYKHTVSIAFHLGLASQRGRGLCSSDYYVNN